MVDLEELPRLGTKEYGKHQRSGSADMEQGTTGRLRLVLISHADFTPHLALFPVHFLMSSSAAIPEGRKQRSLARCLFSLMAQALGANRGN